MCQYYNPDDSKSIENMFDLIAPKYNFANLCISFGLCLWWNKICVQNLMALLPHNKENLHFLDLCCGTGQIAFTYNRYLKNKTCQTTGIDFSAEMLQEAIKRQHGYKGRYTFIQSDITKQIPLDDNTIDQVAIAYGLRNIGNRKSLFNNIIRVLKPSGTIAILELTRPSFSLLRIGHSLYIQHILPYIAGLFQKKEAYHYLAQSIKNFIPQEEVLHEMKESGFINTRSLSISGGIATLFLAEKHP